MFSTKTPTKLSFTAWGDDNPEKLEKGGKPKTIGMADQIKGLINPAGMWEMFLGKKSSEETVKFKERKEQPLFHQQEVVIFSRASRESEIKIEQQTNCLIRELKEQITLLQKSEKALTMQISKVKVEQLPAKKGIYYLRYFEWLITLVKQLRVRVEEGRAWLASFNARKKKRLGYWQMYKKHGTSFGLSNERSLATQIG